MPALSCARPRMASPAWWLTCCLLLLGLLLSSSILTGQETAKPAAPAATQPAASDQSQKVFSIGHSFHVFMPNILADMARAAGFQDHMHLGTSGIGGSRVIQHWDVADDKFKAKALEYFRQIETSGEPIIVTDNGQPMLEVRRYAEPKRDPLHALQGTVLRYVRPTDPVADDEWDAAN